MWTPETVHPSKPVEAFGKEAPRFTSNLLKGESVYLEFDKDKTDKYGWPPSAGQYSEGKYFHPQRLRVARIAAG